MWLCLAELPLLPEFLTKIIPVSCLKLFNAWAFEMLSPGSRMAGEQEEGVPRGVHTQASKADTKLGAPVGLLRVPDRWGRVPSP